MARPLSQEENHLTLAWIGFYCFSGHITLRMILIYCAQAGFRQLQKTKERMLLIISKKKDICKCKGKSGQTGYTPYLGGLAQTLGSQILSKHLLPQSRVREFQQKQATQQPRYNAGPIPHQRTYPWAFPSGGRGTFPMLGTVPHIIALYFQYLLCSEATGMWVTYSFSFSAYLTFNIFCTNNTT